MSHLGLGYPDLSLGGAQGRNVLVLLYAEDQIALTDELAFLKRRAIEGALHPRADLDPLACGERTLDSRP